MASSATTAFYPSSWSQANVDKPSDIYKLKQIVYVSHFITNPAKEMHAWWVLAEDCTLSWRHARAKAGAQSPGSKTPLFRERRMTTSYPIRAQHRLGVTSTLRAVAGFLPGPDTLHSLEALSYGSQPGRMYKRLKGRRWALCANNFPSALEDSQQLLLWVEPVSGSSLATPTQMLSPPQFHRPRVGTPMREDSPER